MTHEEKLKDFIRLVMFGTCSPGRTIPARPRGRAIVDKAGHVWIAEDFPCGVHKVDAGSLPATAETLA